MSSALAMSLNCLVKLRVCGEFGRPMSRGSMWSLPRMPQCGNASRFGEPTGETRMLGTTSEGAFVVFCRFVVAVAGKGAVTRPRFVLALFFDGDTARARLREIRPPDMMKLDVSMTRVCEGFRTNGKQSMPGALVCGQHQHGWICLAMVVRRASGVLLGVPP